MTCFVLPRPDYLERTANFTYLMAELRSNPRVMEVFERSMQARLEGRVKPWSRVKEELDIR